MNIDKTGSLIPPYGRTTTDDEAKSTQNSNLPQKKAELSYYAHQLSKTGGKQNQLKVDQCRTEIAGIRREHHLGDRKTAPYQCNNELKGEKKGEK